VLGFATVDLLARENTLTVWLTSMEDGHAEHTNAVIFDLGDDTVSCRALGMVCDRYLILTDRTPREHPLLISWGAEPCDLAMLAEQTTVAQATLMAAFEAYRSRPGKSELVEPVLSPVPGPLDQAALEVGAPQRLTLAVAGQVMRTWTAWLTTERERVKRWAYMPGGHKGDAPALLPEEFVKRNVVQRITSLPR
jgi:hypothetical protein